MTQVKVFYEHFVGALEEKVNEWLRTQEGKIEVVNVSSDSTSAAKIMYIVYKSKEQTHEEDVKEIN